MTGLAFVSAARRVRADIGQTYRFAHVVRVARLAGRLAFVHREDPRRARTAGLFHDLARLYGAQQLIDECAQRGMTIDPFEHAHPIVLHARLGAELARERYGVSDEGVLSAIRKHTVADARMSRLDVIVYLADALEPGRDYAERAACERLAFGDLDAAMRAVLESTIAYVHRRRLPLAPQTLQAAKTFAAHVPASISGTHLEASGTR